MVNFNNSSDLKSYLDSKYKEKDYSIKCQINPLDNNIFFEIIKLELTYDIGLHDATILHDVFGFNKIDKILSITNNMKGFNSKSDFAKYLFEKNNIPENISKYINIDDYIKDNEKDFLYFEIRYKKHDAFTQHDFEENKIYIFEL